MVQAESNLVCAEVLQYFCSTLMLLHQGSSKPAGTVRYRRRANGIAWHVLIACAGGAELLLMIIALWCFLRSFAALHKLNSPLVEVSSTYGV